MQAIGGLLEIAIVAMAATAVAYYGTIAVGLCLVGLVKWAFGK